jgi:hypothetical protein
MFKQEDNKSTTHEAAAQAAVSSKLQVSGISTLIFK